MLTFRVNSTRLENVSTCYRITYPNLVKLLKNWTNLTHFFA